MVRIGMVLALAALPAFAQAPAVLEGDWSGALSAGGATLHLALHIDKASDGLYSGKLNSLDQGAVLPLDSVQLTGDKVSFQIKAVSGSFEGALSGDKLKGTWTQGMPLPLEFSRDSKAAPAKPAEIPKLTTARMKAFGIPVDLYVPVPPTPVPINGKTQLIYELHITNGGDAVMDLKRIEVLGDGKQLAGYEGQELNHLLYREDEPARGDNRSLPPGVRTVAFLAIAVDAGAPVPTQLRHRIAVEDLTTEGGAVAVSKVKPLVLGPPLRGGDWLAANGPSNTSIHRRALLPVEGRYHIAQRFAIDWLRMGADGKSYSGDAKDNKNYHAYGSEVLAVADGVVVEVKDGIPENVPGVNSRAVPITLETVGGNHIVLDLGGGRFAFYAHLQPGKLRVQLGDKVKRGQVLGLLGNSGNSTEPHLHFHLSDGRSPLGSEGMPYVLESLGALPAQNATVKFGAQ
jgi:murein DD-endopeptidase MepM/ murein hydrolase activator NlpD